MMENNNNTNPPASQMIQPTPVDDLDYSKTPNPQTPPPTPLKTPDVPTSSQLLPKTHNFPLHKILLIALIILAIIFITAYVGVYYLLNQQLDKLTKARSGASPISQTTPTPTPNPTANPDQIGANWKTYLNSKQHYSISYPPEWYIFPDTIGGIIDGYQGTIISSANQLEPHGETLAVNQETGIAITIIGIDKSNAESLRSYLEKKYPENKAGYYVDTSVGNLPALKHIRTQDQPDSGQPQYFLNNSNIVYQINVSIKNSTHQNITNTILSAFKFLDISTTPTCTPRPACLDSEPRCLIPETADMCPKTTPTTNQIACTQEAKQCSDGSYVSRTGPNCEFTPCPEV